MFAEPKPRGFAFSDTAFGILVLMASRRLNSDRFFTRDYTPRVYTQAGLDWIDDNTMLTVLLRPPSRARARHAAGHQRIHALGDGGKAVNPDGHCTFHMLRPMNLCARKSVSVA